MDIINQLYSEKQNGGLHLESNLSVYVRKMKLKSSFVTN